MRISDWSSDVCSSDLFDLAGVEARHRLVADDVDFVRAEAVELGAHRAAIGAQHPDLDEIARLDVGGKEEGARHMVEIVAGREIGRESCRERVCKYVLISVVAGALKKKPQQHNQ